MVVVVVCLVSFWFFGLGMCRRCVKSLRMVVIVLGLLSSMVSLISLVSLSSDWFLLCCWKL